MPLSVFGSLAEIAIVLAQSCRMMSLALPEALKTKSKYLHLSGTSGVECHSLWRQSLSIVREWRQQPLFSRQYPAVCCVDWVYPGVTGDSPPRDEDLFNDIQSAYLAGIDVEERLLEKLPSDCVFPLVDELRQFAEFLELCGRDEQACNVWMQAIQAAESCQCDSQCKFPHLHIDTYEGFVSLYGPYARLLLKMSRIEESLERYEEIINAAPCNDYCLRVECLKEYSEALMVAGRIEASYDALYSCVKLTVPRLSGIWDPYLSLDLAGLTKTLSRHPHIQDNYHLQLWMLESILSWLRIDHGDDLNDAAAGLEREVFWDYANTLVIAGHLQASEDAFAELVYIWRSAYEADWRDDYRPVCADQWYFAVLIMYARILHVNGKVSGSRIAQEMANSLALQNSFTTPVHAEQLKKLEWRLHYDQDDPHHPPQLTIRCIDPGNARPAALPR